MPFFNNRFIRKQKYGYIFRNNLVGMVTIELIVKENVHWAARSGANGANVRVTKFEIISQQVECIYYGLEGLIKIKQVVTK